MVKVFTKDNCPQCRSTKTMLKTMGIAYEEVNITHDEEAREELKALGFTAAPVVVAGDDSWSGFNFEKLKGLKDA